MKMEQVHGELELAKSEMEKLKLNVNEKESVIEHLSCANKKLRNDSNSKVGKLEDGKIELLKALEEAEGAKKQQERVMAVLQSELDNIKVMLSVSQKKLSDTEQEAKALKEWSRKDERVGRLEEEKRKLEEQLKWKKEQFELLIQAYEKVKSESNVSKSEWELERLSLLDEMSAIQSTLDCKNSEAESLKAQLDRCKQALALEETWRRSLESQVSETKTNDCWDIQSSSDPRRDNEEEVSALRGSLRELESDLKEAEYLAKKLEKENQDLLSTVRELQECHIPKAPPSTPPSMVNKIKSKLRSVEQAHKDCALNLRSKEADWNSKIQMMTRDMEDSKLCLKIKEASIKELKKELDDCNAMNTELKLQNEELSLMLQIQNSGDNSVGKYREMLDECYRERDGLMQEVKELSSVVEDLEYELSGKVSEMQIWRSASEKLGAQVEESQRVRAELELSLLAQAGFEEELKLEIYNLKQKLGIVLPEYDEQGGGEEILNKQFLNNVAVPVGKEIDIRGSVGRSPFREIN